MVLRQYSRKWPPDITIAEQNATIPPRVDLSDVVLNARNQDSGNLAVKLCRQKYGEYTVIMAVPLSLQQRVIAAMLRRKMTLQEVGDLRVPDCT